HRRVGACAVPGGWAVVHPAADVELDLDVAGGGEVENHLDALALDEGLLHADHHEVKAHRGERDVAAGGNLETALDGGHLHHVAVHGHGVERDVGRGFRWRAARRLRP